MISHKSRFFIASLALCGLAVTGAPVLAQDDDEARLRKVEAQVRALQRKVFPGGDGRYFEPQINGEQTPTSTISTGTTTALTDVLARLDALEAQLQRLTSQTEENTNAIQLLSTRMDAAPSGAVAATAPIATAGNTGDVATTPMGASATNPVVSTASPAVTPSPTPAAAGPSAERLAAVQAVAKPQTGDAGDDEYSYGYRLWSAGFYPEAQQQLTLFVEKYPSHARATYGRNLLGRAYLDDNKPEQAAPWFLRNYQADKQARRAPDSLLYLAESMIAANDTNRACIALAEFGDTYPAVAAGRLSDQYEASRRKVSCN